MVKKTCFVASACAADEATNMPPLVAVCCNGHYLASMESSYVTVEVSRLEVPQKGISATATLYLSLPGALLQDLSQTPIIPSPVKEIDIFLLVLC